MAIAAATLVQMEREIVELTQSGVRLKCSSSPSEQAVRAAREANWVDVTTEAVTQSACRSSSRIQISDVSCRPPRRKRWRPGSLNEPKRPRRWNGEWRRWRPPWQPGGRLLQKPSLRLRAVLALTCVSRYLSLCKVSLTRHRVHRKVSAHSNGPAAALRIETIVGVAAQGWQRVPACNAGAEESTCCVSFRLEAQPARGLQLVTGTRSSCRASTGSPGERSGTR